MVGRTHSGKIYVSHLGLPSHYSTLSGEAKMINSVRTTLSARIGGISIICHAVSRLGREPFPLHPLHAPNRIKFVFTNFESLSLYSGWKFCKWINRTWDAIFFYTECDNWYTLVNRLKRCNVAIDNNASSGETTTTFSSSFFWFMDRDRSRPNLKAIIIGMQIVWKTPFLDVILHLYLSTRFDFNGYYCRS